MKMTKREALEICIRMWDWLAGHPGARKSEAIDALGLPGDMTADCAACEYDRQWGDNCCSACPVWTEVGEPRDGCSDPTSPYEKWYVSDRADCAAARGVADLARERLAELGDDG